MGLFELAVAGGGFISIGALEALAASGSLARRTGSPGPPSPLGPIASSTPRSPPRSRTKIGTSLISLVSVSVLSILFVVNSLISVTDAAGARDRVGSALQLQVVPVAALFLLYSVAGILVNLLSSFPLSSSLVDVIALFAFVEEFLVYYFQRKDTSGIENRYFDLMLVPITICTFSTILGLKSPKSAFPRLARAVGLVLQGTWFLQMGFSFYTGLVAHGCWLHGKSRGNYTVKCKGHPEYHRARAIATLQFNCHLALLVTVVVGVYSLIAQKNGIQGDFAKYRPLGIEVQSLGNHAQFTLDSDEDVDDGIREEENAGKPKGAAIELSANGYGSHH
ncbi:uncharacterized protein LOC115741325 [Rhodamnia argentea]|uniref:Uncharacterized protein LOC115741325 n=1 Tax=Rhodamnia argentea TaxID=178133 RepID=A0A8B8P8F9_9MYRT|nr:uncharacterized protein LOC115741325 [Rhodamnia argentea]